MSLGSHAIGTATTPAAASASGGHPSSLPLVSVCISAYNVEKFLHQSLGSVVAQTYPNLEVILIDNGSADRTFDVARSFVDDRVHCFRVPVNLGGYQAMNKVASMARGELIAIYHSDDYYQPDIVAKEAAYLQAHPEVGAVFCLQHYIDEQGRIFGGAGLPREFLGKESLGYKEIFRYILRNKNTLICCPTFMVRKSVFDAVGPFDPETFNIACDNEMWLRIARQFPIAILNERLMGYRVGEWQWTARYRRLRTEPDWHFAVMDHFLAKDGWLNELSADDLVEYEFHRCDDNTVRAVNHLILGETGRARELLALPFPWRTLKNGIRRRKLRLLALRTMLKSGFAIGATHAMVPLLRRIGP
ncbi:MAG: glycosyltransferase [Candidatus Acidiferrales bacterium]